MGGNDWNAEPIIAVGPLMVLWARTATFAMVQLGPVRKMS